MIEYILSNVLKAEKEPYPSELYQIYMAFDAPDMQALGILLLGMSKIQAINLDPWLLKKLVAHKLVSARLGEKEADRQQVTFIDIMENSTASN